MRVFIRTGGPSNGAVALRDTLRERGLAAKISQRDRFTRRNILILNWGVTGSLAYALPSEVLNMPVPIAVARDKLKTFQRLKENGYENLPEFWTEAPSDEARGKGIILERHSLTGQSGSGIRVARRGDPLQQCPLYVRYIRKTREFRVHVFAGKAIAVQEKRRESDIEQSADQKLIRNRDNGWVFCVHDVQEPSGLRDMSVAAVVKLGLDFGAADVILGKDGRLYLLEVNTRPGLESPTVLSAYADAIESMINDDSEQHTGDVSSVPDEHADENG